MNTVAKSYRVQLIRTKFALERATEVVNELLCGMLPPDEHQEDYDLDTATRFIDDTHRMVSKLILRINNVEAATSAVLNKLTTIVDAAVAKFGENDTGSSQPDI